ncbi:hypothetical protein THIARS_80261 [Thiomonas delicata]|uniref:Uncharacterized protein n=1 Tax=Thiomonas delicata TaxID=364030 RepID=A0A238D8W8_THIDL|nr:hypothetical protein THIARS_80261 [Thiomonas delicata]
MEVSSVEGLAIEHDLLVRFIEQWRWHQTGGDVIVVRDADDWVAGFQFRDNAVRF